MRKSRFTDEQIVGILQEADQGPVVAVANKHGVSEQAIYTWRKRFDMFEVNDVRCLRQLQPENARLKKLVAERDLEIEVMKLIAAKMSLALQEVGLYWTGRSFRKCIRASREWAAVAGRPW